MGLLGVAVYSWAPLVAGWLDTDAKPTKTASKDDGRKQRAVSDPEESNSASTDSEAEEKTDEPSWIELREWRAQSPWTAPVDLTDVRDPFGSVPDATATAAVEETDEAPEETPDQIIDSLNVELTGTIVGPRRRVALLDGEVYREGDVVLVEQLGTTWELEIREIGNNRVKLGWKTIERVVTVPERQRVGRIEVAKRTN